VLVIGCDDSVAEAVAATLSGRDHRVKLARDVAAAQKLLGREIFDLIVADLPSIDIPGEGSFVEWLRVRQPSLAKRVIWIGTVVPFNGIVSANLEGAQVLPKPFKADQLLQAVETLLSEGVHAAPVEG